MSNRLQLRQRPGQNNVSGSAASSLLVSAPASSHSSLDVVHSPYLFNWNLTTSKETNIGELDFIKIKSLYAAKDTNKEVR